MIMGGVLVLFISFETRLRFLTLASSSRRPLPDPGCGGWVQQVSGAGLGVALPLTRCYLFFPSFPSRRTCRPSSLTPHHATFSTVD